MRFDQDHESSDVEDRRGEGPVRGGGPAMSGILPFLPMLLRSRFGWVIIVLFLGYSAFKGIGLGGNTQRATGGTHAAGKADSELVHFVSFVLDDTQSTWQAEMQARHQPYRHAKLVLFTDSTRTGCGFGDAATGPFYCPEDEHVYIDLGFYRELSQRLGAGGDFAQAYVIAHEMGHHIQKLLGTSDRVHGTRGSTEGANGASVRLELQADCYAGIWAHSASKRGLLETGDLDEALNAAAAIGDDRLQRQSRGTVSPESFTHGTSEQRGRWLHRGYDTGNLEACDTFGATTL
jgi:predicted metalloprotease